MKPDKNDRFAIWLFAGMLLVVFFAWTGWWYYVVHKFTSSAHMGTFGDLFGGINALFSGFAFAGLVVTVFFQQRELSETRRAFAANVEEQRTISRNSTRESVLSVLKIYIELLASTSNRGALAHCSTEKLGMWEFPADDTHIIYYDQILKSIPHLEMAIDAIGWINREVKDPEIRLMSLNQVRKAVARELNFMFRSLEPLEKWETWLGLKYDSDRDRWVDYNPDTHIPEMRRNFALWKTIVAPLDEEIKSLRSLLDG